MNEPEQNLPVFVGPGADLGLYLRRHLPETGPLGDPRPLRQRYGLHNRFGPARAKPQCATFTHVPTCALKIAERGGHGRLRHAPTADPLVLSGRLALLDLFD